MQDKVPIKKFITRLAHHVMQSTVLRNIVRVIAWIAGTLGVIGVVAVLILHVWILPRIAEFRPQLEKSASSALGLTVKIGEIALVRQGLQPAVELRQVRFVDAVNREGLRVDTIEADFSLWTLVRGSFARLALVRPAVHARREADGRIYVAGFLLPQNQASQQTQQQGSNTALNWLLSQPELQIRDGSVVWNDELRNVEPLVITQVRAGLENSGRQHTLQLALTPPSGWGKPVTTVTNWKHGLWVDRSRWEKWSGKVEADIAEINISSLKQYVDLGRNTSLQQGKGRLNVQVEFFENLRSYIVVDASLDAVDMTLGKGLIPLALQNLRGVFKAQFNRNEDRINYSLSTDALAFTTRDGLQWPGGNIRLSYRDAADPAVRAGEVQGNDLDIGVISQLAGRLPLGEAMHTALRRYQPQGQVHDLLLTWQGDLNAPSAYVGRGNASQIGWLAQPATSPGPDNRPGIGVPGLQGAKISFDFNQSGGSMDLNLDKGSAEFPGVFENPRIAFDAFQTKVQWYLHGRKIHVTSPEIRFANSDAEGTVRLDWKTYDGASAQDRFPGVLDLEGTIQKAHAEKVARYLPLVLGEYALAYVSNAVRGGDIRNAHMRIQGDLKHVPFGQNSHGEEYPGTFLFKVPLFNAQYHFVPRYLQNPSDKPWPALTKLNGLLVIDKSSLSVLNATARLSTAPDIVVNDLAAYIPVLGPNIAVGVSGNMRGSLEQALELTRQSPLSDILRNSLTKAHATGSADISLALGLPIMHMNLAIVRGAVTLNDNDIRISPASPLLEKSKGKVVFSEKGFALQDVTANLLGGRATFAGGSLLDDKNTTNHEVKVEAKGDFTAEGLRQEEGIGSVAQLGRFLRGRSPYRATLQSNRSSFELTIDSDLSGMAVNLPVPLTKSASAKLPFHFSNRITKAGKTIEGKNTATEDELLVRFGHMVLAQYERDLRNPDAPRVLRGRVAIGDLAVKEPPPMPQDGVHALVHMDRMDADAWSKVLDTGWSKPAEPAPKGSRVLMRDATASVSSSTDSYLPDQLVIQAPQFVFANRTFESLTVGGAREGRLWKFSLTSTQLNGYVEYLPSVTGGPGGVKARLSYLTIAPANVQEVGDYVRQTADPQSLPFLDIDAANVDIVGYKFDRVVLRAGNNVQDRPAGADLVDDAQEQNVSNAWRIHELTAIFPGGKVHGSGIWGVNAPDAGGRLSPADLANRFVSLRVQAQTRNLGTVLTHFGYAGVVEGGAGSMTGAVSWEGSPVSFDMQTLNSELYPDIRMGRITKMDPGAFKFLSLLSLQGLTRFGDIAQQGFAFDRISGIVHISQGAAWSNDLAIDGPMADIKANGEITLDTWAVNLDVVAQPKVDLSTAALVAVAINPLIGVGSYVAQWVLSKPISTMATQTMNVTGSLSNPVIRRLQGKEAELATARVMKNHVTPVVVNPLWDWFPITGGSHRAPETNAAGP